jgi:hypothetical protein
LGGGDVGESNKFTDDHLEYVVDLLELMGTSYLRVALKEEIEESEHICELDILLLAKQLLKLLSCHL